MYGIFVWRAGTGIQGTSFLRILVRLQLLMITVSFQLVPRFKKNNSIHWFLSNGTVSQVSGL